MSSLALEVLGPKMLHAHTRTAQIRLRGTARTFVLTARVPAHSPAARASRAESEGGRAVLAPVAKGLILIADDDVAAVAVVRERLVDAGYEVVVVADGEAAMAELHRVELDVALVALTLPGRGGLDVLSAAHHLSPETEVIILAHRAQLATALECIRRGAFDLLARPLDVDALLLTVARAAERRLLRSTTALFHASQEILCNRDPADLAATIVGVFARVLEADDVTLALSTANGIMRTRHAWSTTPEAHEHVTNELGDELASRVAALGRPMLLPEDADEHRIAAGRLARVRSCIVFPLSCGERRVGVLTVSRVSDHRPYRRVDVERTAILASQALLAIENAALMQRMVEAERLATVGSLAAGIAHEINNPLTYIMASATEALERMSLLQTRARNLDPEIAKRLAPTLHDIDDALHDVSDGAHRIAAIARDLRALSRAENFEREDVDLSEVVRSARRVTAPTLRTTTRVAVSEDLTPGVFVRGNEGRLVQVVVNFVVNALQASVGRSALAVHFSTAVVGERATLTVADDGPGMPAEHLDRIFQPFFSTKAATEGTGLGLSLSQAIVADHGGSITVESAPGHGAKFVVSFPVAHAACEQRSSADDPRAARAAERPADSAG